VIHKEPTSDYGVTVPDLPGCFSAGETLEKALSNTREAIELHLESMLEDGESMPVVDDIERHRGNEGFGGGVWEWVEVEFRFES